MKAPYKLFKNSIPHNVEVITYTNGNLDNPPKEQWTDTLWVERDEDWYALLSPQCQNTTVRVVTREDYLRSKE